MNIRFILLFLTGVYLHYFSPSLKYYRRGWSYSEEDGVTRIMNSICGAIFIFLNTLWTGDADLRLYITTVQDG